MTLRATIEYYRDRRKEWRWRMRSNRNGKILANSGEGYKQKSWCRRIARRLAVGAYAFVEKEVGR